MINLQTENLKQDIIKIISKSNLPVVNIYYIMKDLMNDVTLAYQSALTQEQKYTEENIDTNIEEE